MKITYAERSALLAVLHGALDDDENGTDTQYSAALVSLIQKVRKERVKA